MLIRFSIAEDENFSIQNRELVNSDDDLKRFICQYSIAFVFELYKLITNSWTLDLRRLDEKLTKLQETAKKAIEEADEDETAGRSGDHNHHAYQDAIDQVESDREEMDE